MEICAMNPRPHPFPEGEGEHRMLLRIESWRPDGHTLSDPLSFRVSVDEKFALGF